MIIRLTMTCLFAILTGCSAPKKADPYILDGQIQQSQDEPPNTIYGKATLYDYLALSFKDTKFKLNCLGGRDSQFQDVDEEQFLIESPKTGKPIDHNLDTWHGVVVCNNGENGKFVMTKKDGNWVGEGNVGNWKIRFRLIHDDNTFL